MPDKQTLGVSLSHGNILKSEENVNQKFSLKDVLEENYEKIDISSHRGFIGTNSFGLDTSDAYNGSISKTGGAVNQTKKEPSQAPKGLCHKK